MNLQDQPGTSSPNLHKDTGLEFLEENAFSWLIAVLEATDDAVIGKNLDGVIVCWNGAAEALFGYTAEEIIGRPITTIIPPERIDEEALILSRIRQGEKLVHFVTERKCKNGKIIPVSLSILPIRDHNKNIIGACKIARDLSEARQSEQELRRREALLRSVLETVPDGMIVIDEHGIIRDFSVAAERLFGFQASEVTGQNVSVLMPSPYREEHDKYLSRYLTTGERHIIGIGRVVIGQRKDGSTFPMELSVGETKLPEGRLFVGFVEDLTERQERERRFRELRSELAHLARVNELGQMVSALAHEVMQPLTALTNYLNAMRRLLEVGKLENLREAMERANNEVERASWIIRRLREFVRKGETERQKEYLPKTIAEASALALVGTGREIKFDIRVAEDAAEALIDKIQIQQVLVNLMRNAVEAMANSARRELSVSAVRTGEMIEISVADTGPGLPEEVHARLFQPFVTTKPNGMGIGLYVCRTIVEAHGGELSADRVATGGTVFRFTVPSAGSATES